MNRYLVTIASPECPGWPIYSRLEQVVPDVAIIEAFFRGQHYTLPLEEKIPISASSQTIEIELDNWLGDKTQCSPEDLLVVYVTGHGGIDRSNNHFLITYDSQENRSSTRIETGKLAGLLFNRDVPGPQNILLLLDVCYAGQGGKDLLSNLGKYKSVAQQGAGFHIIVSAGPFTEAADGAFVKAFHEATQNKAFLGPGGQEYLSPYDLTIAINERLNSMQEVQYDAIAAGRQRAIFIRNPYFTRELDGKLLADLTHWRTKAQGGDDSYLSDWFFSGRHQALRELKDWLRQSNSDLKARLVTSAPGSGKSALLGRLVLAASPDETQRPPNDLADALELETLKGIQSLIAINATGETLTSLTQRLGQRLGRSTQTVEQLMENVQKLTAPLGIVIDSLDEATEPGIIADQLLYPLAGHPAVRLIVGSRRFGERIPLGDRAKEINLDQAPYFLTTDIADYVFARLTRRQIPTVYAPTDQHINARRLASYIAREAKQSFLYARLVSRWFESDEQPLDTSNIEWMRQIRLPDDVPAAFGQDFGRFDRPTRRRIIELLTPLAFAKGKGLPQKIIWYRLANALADQEYRNDDIETIKNQVGYYLIQDSENGETVFRLFHKALADYLRHLTRDQAIEHRYAEALRSLSGTEWQGMIHEPYLRAHLPAHAAEGGQLDDWLCDANFLVKASLNSLIPFLPLVQSPESRRVAAAYRVAVDVQPDTVAALSISSLRWQSIRFGATQFSGQLEAFRQELPTFAHWGVWLPAASSYALVATEESSTALTTGIDLEGNPIAACGYVGGCVRVWNLTDGTLLMEFKPSNYKTDSYGKPESPHHIKFLLVDNDVLLVVAWSLNTLRVLSLISGIERSRAEVVGSAEFSPVSAIQTIDRSGKKILVTATGSEYLNCYSLPDLHPIVPEVSITVDKIYYLAEMTYGNSTVLVTGGDSINRQDDDLWPMIELRDPLDLNVIWKPEIARQHGWISNLSIIRFGNSEWVIAPHSYDGVNLFEPATNRHVSLDRRFYLSELIDWYIQDNTLYVIGLNYGDLRILVLTPSTENPSNPFEVVIHPNSYSVPSLWGQIVTLHDRPTLVGVSGLDLRVWDLVELLSPAPTTNNLQLPPDEHFRVMTVRQDTLVTASRSERLWAFNSNGKIRWIASNRYNVVGLEFVKKNGTDLLAVCLPERIAFVSLNTGEEISFSVAIGGRAIDMLVHTIYEAPIAFIAMQLNQVGYGHHYYAVRAWNLSTGEEVNTLISDLYPQRYSDALSDGAYQAFAFQMKDYYKTKLLSFVRILEWNSNIWVILGAPNAEIRGIDYLTHLEVDSWYVGQVGNNVTTADAFIVNNTPIVVAGNNMGILIVRDLKNRENVASTQLLGSITALCHCNIENRTFLIVGTDRGEVSIWTNGLNQLHQIDTNSLVRSLEMMTNNHLAICTDQGIMVVEIQWSLLI